MSKLSRREQNKVDTRQRIIAAAASMFLAQGVDQSTVTEVAQQAGVSRGTFFNYFPTKDSVLAAMWQDMADGFGRMVTRALKEDISTRQRIHSMFQAFVDAAESEPDYMFLVSGELNRDQPTGDSPASRSSHISGQIIPLLEAGQSAGEVRTDLDVDFLGRMVTAGYIAAILRWRERTGVDTRAEFAQTADFVADSIAPHTCPDGAGALAPPAALGALLDGRHSCRAFRPEPVDRAVVERLLQLAQRTPSWCNTQPWQVAITEGDGTERFRAGLAAYVRAHAQEPDFEFPREYQGEYRARRLETALALYDAVGIPRGDRAASAEQTMKNFDLFGAPHVAVITTDEALGVYGAVDCGLYVNTFLLAAQALGLGAIPQAALAGSAPYLREFFDLPEGRKIVCAISFGHPDAEHDANGFRTTRADTAAVASWHSA